MVTAFAGVIAFLAIVLTVDPCRGIDRIRFAYPAKSLNYLPVMLGRDKGIYQAEGIDLQLVLVTSPVQVTALTTADIDFSGAQSQVMAGAARVCRLRSSVSSLPSLPFGSWRSRR